MIGFAVFVLGFTYLNAVETKKLEENQSAVDRELIVMYMQ